MALFRELAIRGQAGSLVWGYQTAVAFRSWHIKRETDPTRGPWTLLGSFTTINRHYAKQKGLRFTAPRLGRGVWCWPVLDVQLGDDALIAQLGHPEQ